jgi:hypothetical protein
MIASIKKLAEKINSFWLTVIMLISFLLKSSLHFYFNQVIGSADSFLQLAAASEINKGHGYSIPITPVYDLSAVNHQLLLNWPPLYSYLAAPFLAFTNNNYEQASIIVVVIFAFFHQLIWLLLLKKLDFPNWIIAVMLLLLGVAIPDYMVLSQPSDMPAITFWLAAFYFCCSYLCKKSNWTLFFLCLFNVLPAFMRYAYLPIVFVIPMIFLWNAIKEKSYLKAATFLLAFSIIPIVVWLSYNFFSTGQALFFAEAKRGFYPENLIYVPPIFWQSFLNVDFYCTQINKHVGLSYSQAFKLFSFTGLGVLIALIIPFLKKVLSRSLRFYQYPLGNFLLTAGMASVAIFCFLSYMAFTVDKYIPFPFDIYWTYFSDSRYFLLIQYGLLVFIFYFVFIKKNRFRSVEWLRRVFLILMVIEISHGVYFAARHLGERKQYGVEFWNKQEKFLDNIITSCRIDNTEPIVVTYGYNFTALAIFKEIKIINQVAELEKIKNNTNKKILLILVKRNNSVSQKWPFDEFIIKNNLKETKVDDMSYYTYALSN